MIIDKIENIALYYDTFPALSEVERVAKEYISGKHPKNGRIDIDGDNLYCNASTYNTKSADGAEYESHFRYADVQLVVSGCENIGWAPLCDCKVTKPAENGGDIAFYESDKGSLITLHSGYFMLLLPGDAHKPCIEVNSPAEVTKLVFKAKL